LNNTSIVVPSTASKEKGTSTKEAAQSEEIIQIGTDFFDENLIHFYIS